jgi:membrane protein YdbS with pleckstrin-like domain
MRYPESMLSADESVVFDVHHHPFVLFKPFALFCGFLAVWLIVLFLASSADWVVFGGLIILLGLSLFMAWRVQVWSLIYQTGVITRRSREIPLTKINDVSFYQMVLGRLLGMGDLIVESASESGPFAYFNVPGPEKLKMQVIEHIRTAHPAAGDSVSIQKEVAMAVEKHQPTSELTPLPPERPPLYSEIVDQIERLDALRERGTLTPEEFQQAKESLLDKLSREKGIDR